MLKHILLTFSVLALIACGQVAEAQTHFSEDFASGIPAGWTILDNDGLTPNANWSAIGLGNCGNYPLVQGWEGYCGSAMSVSWYTAPGQSDDWLITPAITIPAGVSNAFLRFNARTIQTQRQASFRDDYAVRIGLTTNPADHVANLLHNSNDPVFEEPVIDLTQWIGQTVYISWQNYANNEYALLVDDVEVVTKPDRDITGEDMDIFPYLANNGNPINVAANFYNNGGTTVTAVDVEYTVDGGVPVTGTVTGLNIAPFASGLITHPTQWSSPADGAHEVILSVTAINGGADSNPADNDVDKDISLTSTPSTRNILVETYTSSSCPPCNDGNSNLENVLEALDNPRVISIKFQCPFIGNGDPYGTDEILSRWDFLSTPYGVGGIPHTFVDGGLENNFNPHPNATSNGVMRTTFSDALGNDAFGDFSGTYQIDPTAQSITIDGDFTPSTDMTGNERIQVAICEYETFRNAATNGEFEFFNGVKKMLPNENGAMLSAISAGTAFSFDQVYTFNGSFRRPGATSGNNAANRINHATEHCVEEFEDLFVIAWVENEGELYVLNSGRLTRTYATANDSEFDLATVSVSPNPASEIANINLNLTEVASVKLEVVNVEGKVVLTKDAGTLATGNNSIELNVSDLPAGTYHVTALMEKGMITRPLMIVR